MYFGGDYNPEQWPEHVWDDDIRLMHEARVNLVSVGIFSWAWLQPDEGVFEFGWLDRVLDKLHAGGVAVDLATATASPPPWLVRRYPDVVPVTETGVTLGPGSRQHYAPTSPDYRRLAAALVTALAERYAHHPTVVMWHVNNEYACHVRADFSDHAARAFRAWLSDRYDTIDDLNLAWGTSFWSQRYGDFREIQPPRAAPTTQNPSAVLDFRRFTSDSILQLYRMERDLIRTAGATQPITTNFMGPFPALNYWDWAAEVDLVSDDKYPDPRDPDAFHDAAFSCDLMRSLKPGTPWILMEQAPDAVQWRPNNARKRPGQMAAWSEQALARGASGILYFQWRQSRAGQEKFHSGMVPHGGPRSRTWQEITALGADLEDRPTARPAAGQTAVVYDWENRWALDQGDLPADIDYHQEVARWYRGLHERSIQTSFVHPGGNLSAFGLIIAPALYLLTADHAAALRAFVRHGGVLVTTAFTDVVDEHDQFRAGGYGTQQADLLGGAPVDFYGVEDHDGRSIVFDDDRHCVPQMMIEDFRPTTGTVVARTDTGEAALVRQQFGAGTSLHLTTFPDAACLTEVLELALEQAGVAPVLPGMPHGVEVIDAGDHLTMINQTPGQAVVTTAPGGRVELTPYQVLHLARSHPTDTPLLRTGSR